MLGFEKKKTSGDEWNLEVDGLKDAVFCVHVLDCAEQWTSFRYVLCFFAVHLKKSTTKSV